jgi:PncC family amidohydrolase
MRLPVTNYQLLYNDRVGLEESIGQLLAARHLTVAVAESCTGGLVAHRLTNVPGSSAYFLGGVVAYAYDVKERLLDVNHATLYDFGAVSEQTAREMARGVRRALRADLGASVTGIAGPGGGLPGKPVGLTWIALSTRDEELAEQHLWTGDRLANKEASAEAVLQLLLRHLESLAPAA